MPRSYETLIIVRADVVDEALQQLLSTQQALLQEAGATEVSYQVRGKRRFAYELKRQKEGIYVQFNYQAEPAAVASWEKNLKLNENILRFMTTRPLAA
ncbi:MAG: 30S ribosomal protein S6 [Thermostichales cyanobacterium SZTDM-1c_bins_54]